MKNRFNKSVLSLAVVGSLTAALTWSNTAHACAVEGYISSVCVMASNYSAISGGFGGYLPAKGQVLPVSQNQALFALLGATYGGDGRTTFGLPDLQGRTILGTGTYTDIFGTTTYTVGQKGGTRAVVLTVAQVPLATHNHGLSTGVNATATAGNMTVDFSKTTFNTSLSGVTAATSLSGVTATADGSKLNLQANSGNGGGSSPAGTSLATVNAPSAKLYSTSAPNVAMMTGSIAGTAPVAFGGSPTTTLNGNPTTTISGTPTLAGTPTVTVRGMTDPAGAAATSAVPMLPPYVVMSYYIMATNGVWPSGN